MKSDFKKKYESQMKEVRSEHPHIAMLGADGSPRGSRDRRIQIGDAELVSSIKNLLQEVESLRKKFPQKRFTLDGRLVGDLGEVIAELHYDIALHKGLQKHYDAETADGTQVQIKTTMKESLTFPADHIPDHFLGVRIFSNGSFQEVYNGPGEKIYTLIKHLKKPKNNQFSISIMKLHELNDSIDPEERVPKR